LAGSYDAAAKHYQEIDQSIDRSDPWDATLPDHSEFIRLSPR